MSDLDQLAQRAGIADRYTDVWGAERVVSAETKRALLAAMGIVLDGPDGAAGALARLERADWQQPLSPIEILTAEHPGVVLLTLPADTDTVAWTLTFEHGAALRGTATWSSLPRHATADLDGRAHERRALTIEPLPAGYHTLSIAAGEIGAATTLLVAPERCWLPPVLRRTSENRVWGVAAQLYGVRSARNWGIGDLTDLAELAQRAAALGAQLVGINPLHALFPEQPERCSPYAPSSRLFLNPIYLDVERVEGFADCAEARAAVAAPEFQARLAALRAAPLVDHSGVMAAKRPVLELLYQHFLRGGDRVALDAFRLQHGLALERHAIFEALSAHFADRAAWWGDWPGDYHDPASPAVAAFATAHAERVGFFAWLQWQTDRQLAAAQVAARGAGMAIGLYRDLAVGADRAGAETWLEPARWAVGATIGAPPDHYNLNGQDWGLPPVRPDRLRDDALRPLIALLRANMARAGALRIDHAFALARLFWVPQGRPADQGAYVVYPFAMLLAAVKLESQRNRCLVIGEDLGTVPHGFREACAAAGVLSYRLLYFERDGDGDFIEPAHYPALALAAASTHDLPTVTGWWHASDIALRESLDLFPNRDLLEYERAARARDRDRLRAALAKQNLIAADHDPAAAPARAAQRYLARSRAAVMIVQLEDVLGLDEQVNLPGTTDQHPNWRRKLPVELAALTAPDGPLADLAPALEAERPRRAAADDLLARPTATYRVQLHKDFTLHDAAALVPYLAALGISHLYAASYLTARPGSRHGYDIVDHTTVNPELGGEAGLRALTDALVQHGMGHILDVVPNHMGVGGADNAWWLDVLEWGEASRYAGYFDIDWGPRFDTGRAKLLLPILGGFYGDVLAAGELKLGLDAGEGGFSVWYFGHRLPVCPVDYPAILEMAVARVGACQSGDPAVRELGALIEDFRTLDPARDAARDDRPADTMKLRLADLIDRAPAIAAAVAAAIEAINDPSGPNGLPKLHDILEAQHYRVAYWRVSSEINYRRFFDINDLAGLRMENRALFDHTHRLVFALLDAGRLHGLRVDHIDGLADPAQYCQRVQERAGPDLYLVVEKILAAHEHLPAGWPIAGTTGYEALNQINGVFVAAAAERGLDRVYRRFTGRTGDFDTVLREAKLQVLRNNLASELQVLTLALKRIADADPRTRDHTLDALDRALRDTIAWFPVYRTYVTARLITPEDRQHIDWAIGGATRHSQLPDLTVFDFLRSVLTLEHRPAERVHDLLEFVRKFQQLTGPVMAKGFEDTSLYRYTRLLSLNEVGGDPRRFGLSIAAFHHVAERRLATTPHAMTATASHDTKRGEDVRARLNALSEMPAAWGSRATRWSRMNRLRRRVVDALPAPSRDDEYLIYQTLVGSWPLALDEPAPGPALDSYVERLTAYVVKALREAKTRTSWTQPNPAYEAAVTDFVRRILDARRHNPFLAELAMFQRRLAALGATNGLAQTVLKLTMPGVPDIYQGTELWDFSLVDPDNRRAVDYGVRQRALTEDTDIDALMASWSDGRIKQRIIRVLLHHRRAHRGLYQDGTYEPVTPAGPRAEQLLAFRRRHDARALLVLVPVLTAGLVGESGFPIGTAVWRDTAIPVPSARRWRDLFTGALVDAADDALPAAAALARLPVACLEPAD